MLGGSLDFRTILARSNWLLLGWMLFVALFSTLSAEGVPGGWDRFIHFLAFLPYGFLFPFVINDVLLSLGVPLYSELIQIGLPWKTFDPIDLGFNFAGTLLGFLIGLEVKRRLF